MTYALIAVNVLVFLYMWLLPPEAIDSFINAYALIPAQIVAGKDLITLITSMFIHGSLGHIAGNMLFLYIFGDNLEDRLGHFRYLLYYLICGLGGSILQIIVDPASTIPNIGASGAIAGLMGGYLFLFPHNTIDVLFETGPFLEHGTVPAFAMLVYWFIAQLFYGAGSLAMPDVSGVAYSAHVGGFIAGFGIIFLNKSKLRG
jgi:membrane associated rhomboid family serine protease